MTVPVHPTPDLRDRLRRALADAGGWDFDRLEPHDFQDETDRLLAIVQPELDVKQAEISRLIGFIERGFDTHMQFGVIGADGVTTMQPCADWCYACKLDLAREAAKQRADMLEEARDLPSNAGHNRAHVDDWPDIIPALRELIAECAAETRRADAEGLAGAGIFSDYYRRWQSTITQARRQAARADAAEEELAEDVGVIRALRRQRDEAEAKVAWLGPAHSDALDLIIQLSDERDQLHKQLATVRAYAEDLYTAPQKVSACGVRERLLDILTPTGPARTIEEAMAGQPVTPKPCPERVVHPAHTWEQGRRDHRCSGDLTYTTTKEVAP